jgi:transcription-repair coupling factor (superfamily II helicase)
VILPFVREVLADVEKSPGFQQAALYLKQRRGESKPPAGRIRLSGLISSAKALLIPYLQRAAGAPLILIVPDNRAAEAVCPVIQSFCELTGACNPQAVVKFPAYDALPFENMSPHPDIQEERATALWKIATNAASIVIAPLNAASMRLHSADHYTGLARIIRRTDMVDTEELVQHLNTIGYSAVDVVEMPGQYAVRGSLFDAYPPEADRPMRIELFGDEVESIRKFDPGTQRSASAVDEVVLLPLSETPVREELLTEIHARLSGARLEGEGDAVRNALADTGVAVFPGWEFYANAGAEGTLFDLLPNAVIFTDEPTAIEAEQEHWWGKVVQRHEQSLVGKLATPEDIYLPPDEWNALIARLPGGSLEHLNVLRIARAEEDLGLADPQVPDKYLIEFPAHSTSRFHGSVPAMVEEVKKLTAQGQRVMFAAPNTGEMERLADIFTEYQVPFRMGTRTPVPGSETYLDETAYFSGDLLTTTIVRATVPEGVALPDARLVMFGARDLFDDSEIEPQQPLRRKS